MATPFYLVILGGASIDDKSGYLPDPEDVGEATQIAAKAGFALEVHLVDSNLLYVERKIAKRQSYETKEILQDAEKVEAGHYHLHVVPPFKLTREIVDSDHPVIYLVYGSEKRLLPHKGVPNPQPSPAEYSAHTSYEIMSSLDSYRTENRAFIAKPEYFPGSNLPPVRIAQIITEYLIPSSDNILIRARPYNFYAGTPIQGPYARDDVISAFEQVIMGCQILPRIIEAGFDVEENKTDIPGWMMNPETPILKGIIYEYGLDRVAADKTPFLEIRESAVYRAQLYEYLARIVYHFAIQWNLFSPNDYTDWHNPAPYSELEKRLLTRLTEIRDKTFNEHIV